MIVQARDEGGPGHGGLGRGGKNGRTGICSESTVGKICWLAGCKVPAKWRSRRFCSEQLENLLPVIKKENSRVPG